MVDKARASLAGSLGSFRYPCPIDRQLLALLRLDADEFADVVVASDSDAKVLAELEGRRVPGPKEAWFDPVALASALGRDEQPASALSHEKLPHGGFSAELVGVDQGIVGLSVLIVEAPPGEGPRLHRHPYDEIIVVQEGRGRYIAGDSEVELGPGYSLTIPAGTPHKFVNVGPEVLRQVDIHANSRFITEWLEAADGTG
jgi:mannose-6-phosphate isomerase-like protein (cupin superfamily)